MGGLAGFNEAQLTDEQIASIDIEECEQYGKWNYTIRPRSK